MICMEEFWSVEGVCDDGRDPRGQSPLLTVRPAEVVKWVNLNGEESPAGGMEKGAAADAAEEAVAEDSLKEDAMKIAVAVEKKDKDAKVDPRFGRAGFFAVYDDEKKQYEFASNNQNLSLPQGAGIQAAKSVVDTGADILIARNVGPKAYDMLTGSGVEIYICGEGLVVREAIDQYVRGKLSRLEAPNAKGHW